MTDAEQSLLERIHDESIYTTWKRYGDRSDKIRNLEDKGWIESVHGPIGADDVPHMRVSRLGQKAYIYRTGLNICSYQILHAEESGDLKLWRVVFHLPLTTTDKGIRQLIEDQELIAGYDEAGRSYCHDCWVEKAKDKIIVRCYGGRALGL